MKKKKLLTLGLASICAASISGAAFADENYFAELEKDLVDGTLTIKADDPSNYDVTTPQGWSYNNMIEIIVGVLSDKYNVSSIRYDYENKDYSKLTFEKYGNCGDKYHEVRDSQGNIMSSYTSYECDLLDSKTVNVKYTGVNQARKAKIKQIIAPIAEKKAWNGAFEDLKNYVVDDLSFVNYVAAGYGSKADGSDEWRRISNKMMSFSAEYREDIANKNIHIIVDNRAGDGAEFFESTVGFAGIVSDGYIYDVIQAAGARLNRVIYIPEVTADSQEAFVAAAQKRIDDYYKGTNLASKITVSYSGESGINSEFGVVDRYYIEYDGHEVDCAIIKDDNKITTPSFAAGDVETNIVISSSDASIPLDTAISVKKIDNAQRTAKIEQLGLKEADIFDISLYSDVAGKKVEKLNNNTFKVSIPVDPKYNGRPLKVYYFAQDGTAEEFTVTPEGNFATFITNHFSEYILGTTEENAANPPTVDNIATYAIIFVSSVVAAGAVIKARK